MPKCGYNTNKIFVCNCLDAKSLFLYLDVPKLVKGKQIFYISHMSLPTGYGCNHEAVIYHYYHSGSNIYQQQQQHVLSNFVFTIPTFLLQNGFHF